MASKRNSLTTPGHKMQERSALAELVMLRSYLRLPPYFWRDSRWKWKYTQEVKAISKFIKKYGLDVVSKILRRNYISTVAKDYGNIEVLLQREMDSISRLAMTKDTTEVKAETLPEVEDLRGARPSFVKKKTLFERLSEIEDDNGG